jgi:perosamine synthetase
MSEELKYLPVAEPIMSNNELSYVSDCVTSGWVSSQGKYLPRFEQEFADNFGTKYTVAVGNGIAAIKIVLAILGISPRDEAVTSCL